MNFLVPRRIAVISLAIALAVLGDAALYTVLPVYAEELGIRIALVGVLLSANRLVRLITNTWAGRVHDRFHQLWPFVVALAVGGLTTALYGLLWGFATFLAARIVWGTCWSFLRQEGYAAVIQYSPPQQTGRLMGIHKSLVSSGMMAGGFLGGVLTDAIGYRTCLFSFAGLTLFGCVLLIFEYRRWSNGRILRARVEQDTTVPQTARTAATARHLVPPRWFLYGAGFANVLVNGGVLDSTLGRLFRLRFGLQIGLWKVRVGTASATGILVFIRWVVSFLLGPVLGHITDRWGRRNLLIGALLLNLSAWILLTTQEAFLLLALAAIIISLARTGIAVSLDASIADLATTHRAGRLVSRFVTFSDLGSACGPLISYMVLGLEWRLEWVYLGGLMMLACLLFILVSTPYRKT